MADLPDPLVPAEVDLSDFAFMPLDVRRLRDSRLAATLSGDEFMAWVLLLCASWHQRPAGSLPSDDIELAQLAGFGRVVKEWRRVSAGALYGWVLCSDSRYYHDLVAEKALDAWKGKLEHQFKRELDRIRKENKKRAEEKKPQLPTPTYEQWNSARSAVGKPTESAKRSGGIPSENPLIGTGTGTGTGKEQESNGVGGGREDLHLRSVRVGGDR